MILYVIVHASLVLPSGALKSTVSYKRSSIQSAYILFKEIPKVQFNQLRRESRGSNRLSFTRLFFFSAAAKSDYTRRHKKWRVHSLVEHTQQYTSLIQPSLFFCSSRGIYELGDMPVYILVLLLRRYIPLLDYSILNISFKK